MKNIILKWITTPEKQKNTYVKIALCCNVVSICLLSPYANAALSATTANVIQGTQPYLSFDNGATPELTTEKLLTITIGDQDYTAANAGTFDAPIQLPATITTVDKVQSYVTKTVGTTAMSADIINIAKTNNLGYDSDGDKIISGEGTVSIDWKDFRGQPVSSSSAPLNPCFGPYQLTVSTTAATLNTQYGLPPDSKIEAPVNNSVTYYIAPHEPELKVCYAAPTSTTGSNNAGTGWNATYQWFNNVATVAKFPTTGFNEATFIIRIVGSKNTPTLTVSGGAHILGEIDKEPKSTLHPGNNAKITLKGMTYNLATYNNLVKVPATFTVTVDSTNVYQFVIKKWFLVADLIDNANAGDANVTCSKLSLGGGGQITEPNYYKQIVKEDMTTDSSGQATKRQIGGGAVAEWGGLKPYKNSGWENQYYWAGWDLFSNSPAVSSNLGLYSTTYGNSTAQGVACVRK